ncbi:MAG: DUF4315 family protein [Clostridia bacterium]
MNAKIKKIIREIEKNQMKICELQEKQKNLDEERIVLENLEIVDMFRKTQVTSYNISEIMNAFKTFSVQNGMKNAKIEEESCEK